MTRRINRTSQGRHSWQTDVDVGTGTGSESRADRPGGLGRATLTKNRTPWGPWKRAEQGGSHGEGPENPQHTRSGGRH
jgi:hypothetical protein